MSVEIRLPATRAEHEALYAFRYRIYVEEMERPQKHADHSARQYIPDLSMIQAVVDGDRACRLQHHADLLEPRRNRWLRPRQSRA